jgi:hypothetical protein
VNYFFLFSLLLISGAGAYPDDGASEMQAPNIQLSIAMDAGGLDAEVDDDKVLPISYSATLQSSNFTEISTKSFAVIANSILSFRSRAPPFS